jgi:hypothetical protein
VRLGGLPSRGADLRCDLRSAGRAAVDRARPGLPGLRRGRGQLARRVLAVIELRDLLSARSCGARPPQPTGRGCRSYGVRLGLLVDSVIGGVSYGVQALEAPLPHLPGSRAGQPAGLLAGTRHRRRRPVRRPGPGGRPRPGRAAAARPPGRLTGGPGASGRGSHRRRDEDDPLGGHVDFSIRLTRAAALMTWILLVTSAVAAVLQDRSPRAAGAPRRRVGLPRPGRGRDGRPDVVERARGLVDLRAEQPAGCAGRPLPAQLRVGDRPWSAPPVVCRAVWIGYLGVVLFAAVAMSTAQACLLGVATSSGLLVATALSGPLDGAVVGPLLLVGIAFPLAAWFNASLAAARVGAQRAGLGRARRPREPRRRAVRLPGTSRGRRPEPRGGRRERVLPAAGAVTGVQTTRSATCAAW